MDEILVAFAARIVIHESSECWIWNQEPDRAGYGRFQSLGLRDYAHRVSHRLFIGPIPPGMHVDHLCRVRRCVNPDHLEAVTSRENNVVRADRSRVGDNMRAKTHCPHGHPYSGANLYVSPSGKRMCRTCQRANWTRQNEMRRKLRNS